MIQFRTLGALDLRGSDGNELRSILAQPKRVALLAYLAVEPPHGFHRRDTLLALFWPELDAEHARAALRKAIHFLRRSLGDGVLVGRGDEELGLAAGGLWCDAVAFEETLDAGQTAAAIEWYRGDLLEGFHISDAPDFDRWLDEERDRLRTRAVEALWTLAQASEPSGDLAAASQWARRAAALAPYDEGVWRGLMSLLARMGDRGGALQAYEEFARRLQKDFSVDPSPETRGLYESVRAGELEAAEATSSRASARVLDPAVEGGVPVHESGGRGNGGTAIRGAKPGGSVIAAGMERLKGRYRELLAARLEGLEAAKSALASGDPGVIPSIRRIAHSLRGSGAIYDYPQITAAAGVVEDAEDAEISDALGQLLAVLREATGGTELEKVQLLIVEDDPAISEFLVSRLAAPNRAISVAATAAQAEEILLGKEISLIILDLILPDEDGRNLLVRLREHPATAAVPVIVTSATQSDYIEAECFSLGADAYFEKPVDPGTLAAVVSARLQRAGEMRGESRVDAVSGLPNRAAFRESFERAASLAARTASPLTLALLEIDRFQTIRQNCGATGGYEVLRRAAGVLARAVRTSDLVARWEAEQFVVLFPTTELEGATRALEKALALLREERFQTADGHLFTVTFSAGVAEVWEGASIEEAIAEADYFLYLARSGGQSPVSSAENKGAAPRQRVLLAEDDQFIAAGIKHGLGREGFDVLHFGDGAQALAAGLAGTASLVILDVQMPGMDGFEVLERLRAAPALTNVPIMMLTARRSEEDIVRGFQLGANDYIVKPFSPVELVARVHRLLKSAAAPAAQ